MWASCIFLPMISASGISGLATVSYACGMAANFFLNKYLNFRDTSRNYLRQFFFFALISMRSLALTLGILYLAVEIFAVNYLSERSLRSLSHFSGTISARAR